MFTVPELHVFRVGSVDRNQTICGVWTESTYSVQGPVAQIWNTFYTDFTEFGWHMPVFCLFKNDYIIISYLRITS